MASWVKGGTTSARYDEQLARERADADKRRAQEDQRKQLARDNPLDDMQKVMRTGNVVSQRELNFGGPNHAQAVLGVKHPKDNQILNWQVCELVLEMGSEDVALCLVCMRCIYTLGRSMQQAQTKILNSHRAFSLDQRTRQERKPNQHLGFCAGDAWINPEDPNEVVTIAAMVTTHGWQTCAALGCGWRFLIDDSVIHSG